MQNDEDFNSKRNKEILNDNSFFYPRAHSEDVPDSKESSDLRYYQVLHELIKEVAKRYFRDQYRLRRIRRQK